MKKAVVLLVCTCLTFSGVAQNYESDSIQIAEIITEIFDGMRQSDTMKMAGHMHSSAKMQSLNVDGSGNKVSKLSGVAGWLNAVAKNSDVVWDEQVDNLRVQSDGSIATAWMNYKFYLGDELSHCGTNSFQFIKTDEKWKIIYVIDSRNEGNCKN